MRSRVESEIGCTVTIGVGALSEMMPSGYDLIDAVDAGPTRGEEPRQEPGQ